MSKRGSSAADLVRPHHFRAASGRDPHEVGRVATPLELLYDLIFVVAIGQAANQMAHLFVEGYFIVAIGGFVVAMFGVVWAWVNFSWFASAFDTDDWPQRLATMVQMLGVTVLGLGIPTMFHSLIAGHGVDTRVMVAGYVVMRVAMLFLWLRAAFHSKPFRSACITYAWTIALAQIGWVATAWVQMTPLVATSTVIVLLLIEFGGPYLAEKHKTGTPWHAHHIAERYGLLTIIALGEGVAGTVASLSAVVNAQGWSMSAVLVGLAGMGLTFSLWWCYFLLPSGEILHARRDRAFPWAYVNWFVLVSIVAAGAGLHIAALFIAGKAVIGSVATVLAVATPVAVFIFSIYALYFVLYHTISRFHISLLLITALVLAAGPTLAAEGVSMPICLLVVMAAPCITVLGYEVHGHKEVALALARVLKDQ